MPASPTVTRSTGSKSCCRGAGPKDYRLDELIRPINAEWVVVNGLDVSYRRCMKLRLHTRYQNSAGQRVRIVLNLKRVPYEYVAISSLSSDAYRKLNPQGLMPALEIDGRVVAQSMAIVELLEELFPEPSILPNDPILRAEARSFAHLISADLHPINNNRIRRYLSDVMGADESQVLAWYHHWLEEAFSSLETHRARQPAQFLFCYGDRPGLADACLVPQMDNARRFKCDLSKFPRLLAVDAECRKLEEFSRAAPEMQPDYPRE